MTLDSPSYLLFTYILHRQNSLHIEFPRPRLVLGYCDQDLCFHFRLCGSRLGHHHLLRPDDPSSQECTLAVRLQREGQKPPAHHPYGFGCGGGLHHLLDPHPYLHHNQNCGGDRPEKSACGRLLASVYCSGLHEQQPQPGPVCISG